MTQKTTQNPWQLDVRVRERNLKAGSLTDKDVEKYLTQLTDVADQAEPFATPQPALAQPEMPVDLGVDDEEDDDDLDEAPIAEESAPEVSNDGGGETGGGDGGIVGGGGGGGVIS